MSLVCSAEDSGSNLSRHKDCREAKEVFLYMNKNVRISRDLRARWFFEHLDKLIALHSESDNQNEEANAETFGVAIMGAIPKGGPTLQENEKLRICTNTHITYFSKYYCLVFILDFSPSCFVSDDSGCVLYNKLVESAVKCLQNITKSFTFSGSNNTYIPRIYASFCAFTPFLCFPENSVLLQSVLLSYDNVNGVIDFLRIQIKNFIDKLCVFAQPHMKEWSRRRRVLRRNNENDLTNLFQQAATNAEDKENLKEKIKSFDTPQLKDGVQMSDQGFIQPDWALIFMLRMGLMSAQNCLADNIQSNIIIVTDGVCGIPDSQALQNVLAQIRSFSISCSFIQLNQTLRGPTLGHVGFPELFHFLATATFGYYLTEPQLNADANSLGYNIFHRSFLAWSFQRALIRNTIIPDIVPRGLRTMHIRNRRMSRVYEATLCRLLYVRLREGYTIKHLDIQRRCDDSETIFVKLSLLWKPQTSIEYIISSPWNGNPQKKHKIQVDVFVDAVVNSTPEASMEAQSNDAVKSIILNISDADCLMLHVYLFNSDIHYYKLPKEFDESLALFEYRKHAQRAILNPKYECLKNSKFVAFWQPLCALDERIWQKWAHTHTVRAVLNYDAVLPDKLFTPSRHKGRYAEFLTESAFQTLHSALRRLSTFTLIKEQSYVTMLYENNSDDCLPKYFYIIRVSVDMPFIVLKVAFLGGVPGPIRKKIMVELKKTLEHLRMQRESIYMNPADDTAFSSPNYIYRNSFSKFTNENALFVIAKPLERTLVRYRRPPKNLHQLVRLERSDKLRENREMILHNAIAKYLSCWRSIWQLRRVFIKNMAMSNHSLEFIMQTLLRRRLNQGFHVAYGKNGIANLIRQRDDLRVEQCVLFGPTHVEENGDGGGGGGSDVAGSEAPSRKLRKTSLSVSDEPRGAKFANFDSNQSRATTAEGADGGNETASFTQLILEMWTEPHDRIGELAVHDTSAAQLVAENGIIIRTLFTFEQWQSACAAKVVIDRLPDRIDEMAEAEGSAPPGAVPSATVECIRGAFDLCELLTQANEKQVCYLPALNYADSDPHSSTRLEVLFVRLQQELADSYDACVPIGDETVPRCVIDAARDFLDDLTQNYDIDKGASSPTAQGSMCDREQLHSPTVRYASVSPPASSNSFSSFQFDKQSSGGAKRCEKPPAQFYPENFDHSAYLETLCEHRSTSVPLLSTSTTVVPTLPCNDETPGTISVSSCRLSTGAGGSAFEPVMRNSTLTASQHWSTCLPNKSRLTAGASLLAPTRSASNVIGMAAIPNAAVAGSGDSAVDSAQDTAVKKKHSASTFSNDELSSPGNAVRISLRVPTKKLSAPPQAATAVGRGSQADVIATGDESSVQDDDGQLPPGVGSHNQQTTAKVGQTNCQWKLYLKRINAYRLVFLIVPREVRTVQAFHAAALVNNTFPIFVFHCDKARIAQNLSSPDYDFGRHTEDILVENFCRKSEASTIAYLKQQIERRARREARRAASVQEVLEMFYVNAAVTADVLDGGVAAGDDAPAIATNAEDSAYTIFDLVNYCELVFEEYIYTKCYIATVYACLGQEIFVPPAVLDEVLDYRCEHIRVEIGSINEILTNTCAHMRRSVKAQQENEPPTTRLRVGSLSKCQRKTQKLFSSSSSSEDESDSASDVCERLSRRNRASASTSNASDILNVEVLFDNSATEPQSTEVRDVEIDDKTPISCEDGFDDFRQSFDELLKQHSFVKVPGLSDYFFYWPQPTFLLNQQKMLDNVIEDMSHILTPGTNSHLYRKYRTGNSRRTSVTLFSRRSGTVKNGGSSDTSGGFVNEFSNDSSDVGGYYDGSDEAPDSEDSAHGGPLSASHGGELFGQLRNWPLFVQFSASVYVLGQVHSVAIEFIPNCLHDILRKCPIIQENELDDLTKVEVSIEMYVFTWPLPSQCSYKECLQFFGTGGANTGDLNAAAVAPEAVSGSTSALDETATAVAESANANANESFESSMLSTSDFVVSQVPTRLFRFPQALSCYSAFQADESDEVFKQPVEILRKIPAYEHRLLRKIQRGIQRMLKMEYILISSREFEVRPRLAALRRVMRFVTEEISHANKHSGTTKATDRRCALMCKELVIVSDPQFGLGQLYERLDGLKIDYCTLRRFRPANATAASPRQAFKKRVSRFLANERTLSAARAEQDMLFYACRADSAEEMARSIVAGHRNRQVASQRRPAEFTLKDNDSIEMSVESLTQSSDLSKPKMLSGSSIVTIPHARRNYEDCRATQSSSSATILALSCDAIGADEYYDEGASASIATAAAYGADDDEILSDITMPLNDGERPPFSIMDRIKDAMNMKTKLRHLSKGHTARQLLYDFWLIVQIARKKNESPVVKIYFCNRSPAVHADLFLNACQIVEEQIKIVNQTLLLEKMHRTEECDPLLVDTDSMQNSSDYQMPSQPQYQTISTVQIAPHYGYHHSHHQHHGLLKSGERSKTGGNGALLSRHVAQFVQQPHKQSSELQKGLVDVSSSGRASTQSSGSLSDFDEEDEVDADRDIGDLVRYKYGPGFFACDMKWHCWFPIHRRLRSTGTDNGFIGLRVGLEQLAVRNRSNMYVYREKSKNIVYMRLHSNADSIFANIPNRTESWRDEVLANSGHSILLAVHGVNPPGEEITVQLRNVLQRRLNKKTLEEIQNALLKNAHIRLEWSDIYFIQSDPQHPDSVVYFTIPSVAQDYLLAVKHYFTQQLQTFCILPKFREQSGMYIGGCYHHAAGFYQHHSHNHQHSANNILKSHSSSGDFSAAAIAECECCLTGSGEQVAMRRSQHASGLNTPPMLGTVTTAGAVTPVSFLPFVMEDGPDNPRNYTPTFFLFNKPAGEGKRDTGIACLEMKLVDWRGAVVENARETGFQSGARSLLYPSVRSADKHQQTERFQIISKCLQIEKLDGAAPINGTCALFQFNIWKNGNVEMDELQARLKMCAQQAITDLITEFGLLSAPIFEASFRSNVGSFSFPISEATQSDSVQQSDIKGDTKAIVHLQRQNAQDPNILDIGQVVNAPAPIAMTRHGITTESSTESTTTIQTARPHKHYVRDALPNVDTRHTLFKQNSQLSATLDSTTAGGGELPYQSLYQYFQKTGSAVSSTALAYAVSPIVIPPKNIADNATIAAISSATTTSTGESAENLLFNSQLPLYQQTQKLQQPLAVAIVPPQHYLQQQRASTVACTPTTSEFLRADFASVVVDWFDHVYSTTKGFPEMSHSVRKFNFILDCDGSTRKVIQVIYERLRQMLRAEKIVLCCAVSATPSTAATNATPKTCSSSHSGRHLQALLSSTPLLEPFEKDFGRIIHADEGATNELVLLGYPERQFADTIQFGNDLTAPIPATLQKLVTESNQGGTYSKFLPLLRPFVPRQRVMYLVLSDENVMLFLYNYNNEVVLRVKEVVERAILWHNARSRLLREIGLQKMGVTHLSTLKSADMKFNSYLLLSWMNPELLIRNDYPADSLTTPDFSKIPRTFAQFLLKLYRFYDPAFVAKNLNVFPFEDQTQQMLTLREDVRTMLNEQRIFGDVHRQLLNQQRNTLPADFFNRIICRSRQVHYVQSPLLIFPNCRRIIASVRSCGDMNGRRSDPLPGRRTPSVSSCDNVKSRPKTGSLDHQQARSSITSEESCLMKVQQMLLDNYVVHLRMLGLSLLNISANNKQSDSALTQSMHQELSGTAVAGPLQSGGSVGSRAQHQANKRCRLSAESGEAKGAWLYAAMSGGILFVQLNFIEPYFCVRIFQWNSTRPISLPNSPTFKAEMENIRHLEKKKNELIQKCHVHSFTYDFHLRIVSRYLTGGKQNLLLPGYNISTFLTDFLQYYECRPPNARNCLYEETLKCNHLQVAQSNIWEFFLDNKTQFAWNVIRLKTIDTTMADEFMLVSKNEIQLLNQTYKLVRIVINNNSRVCHQHSNNQLAPSPAGAAPASGSVNSGSTAPSGSITAREHEIALKFYVLLVNDEMTYPITDELKLSESEERLRSRDHNPSGEFTRVDKNCTASSLPVDGDATVGRRLSDGQPSEQHHYNRHRSAVGAKFSYCCETATAATAASDETRVKDIITRNMTRMRATSLAGRRRSTPSRHLKITASTGEITDDGGVEAVDSEARLFLAEFDEVGGGRKRFSSGDNLDGRSSKHLSKVNAASTRRISDASSILPTSLVPNLGRLFASNNTSNTANPASHPNSSNSASPEVDSVEAVAACGDEASSLLSSYPTALPKSSPTPTSSTSTTAVISFQKIPPRRHFRFGQDALSCLCGSSAVVPAEQIIYFHYLSGVQRKLQSLLERIVDEKRAQLLQFVHEADQLCYIDMLWRSLLSSKSTHVRRQPTTIFSAATNSKSDLSNEAALHKSLKLSGSVEMDLADFAALLRIVRVEPMAAEEPRLGQLLAEVNFAALCRFLLQYYESEHRCRYFVQAQKSYLIITNPSFLDSAAMFRNDPSTSPSVELFLLFKHVNGSRAENEPFSANAIQKLFEDIVACLSAFAWSDLLHNLPLL